jgi:dienelactone hydrolase
MKPNRKSHPAPATNRRHWLQAAALLATAAALPLRAMQAMLETVPGAVSALDIDGADPARQREVPVRLYLPAQASAATPVPLVVFSHGIGGSRSGYSYLGRHWAGQGFASLHVQHVGSDRSLWFGNIFSLVNRLQGAAQDGEAVARVLDLRFALDQLLASPTGQSIDAGRIAVAGHSYGANTTLLAAGARVPRPDKPIDLHDARFKAAIIISAPPFYGEGNPAPILAPISVPSLHITATDDVIRIPGYYSGADDRVKVFDAIGSARKWLAVFEGGSHSMFTDRSGTGGALLNPQVKAATQDLSVAFLRQVFAGDDSALRGWPQRHAAIVARVDGW